MTDDLILSPISFIRAQPTQDDSGFLDDDILTSITKSSVNTSSRKTPSTQTSATTQSQTSISQNTSSSVRKNLQLEVSPQKSVTNDSREASARLDFVENNAYDVDDEEVTKSPPISPIVEKKKYKKKNGKRNRFVKEQSIHETEQKAESPSTSNIRTWNRDVEILPNKRRRSQSNEVEEGSPPKKRQRKSTSAPNTPIKLDSSVVEQETPQSESKKSKEDSVVVVEESQITTPKKRKRNSKKRDKAKASPKESPKEVKESPKVTPKKKAKRQLQSKDYNDMVLDTEAEAHVRRNKPVETSTTTGTHENVKKRTDFARKLLMRGRK